MEKADHVFMIGLYLCRQRPTLPHTFACSTIGPAGLNLRRFAGVSEARDPLPVGTAKFAGHRSQESAQYEVTES